MQLDPERRQRHTTRLETIFVAFSFMAVVGFSSGLRLPGETDGGLSTASALPSRDPSPSVGQTLPPATLSPSSQARVTVVAAGDIACDVDSPSFYDGLGRGKNCRMMATAALIGDIQPDAVLPLGDNQYEDGAAAQWSGSFDPSWGRYKSIIHPVIGNHEYLNCGVYTRDCSYMVRAEGYAAYFGEAAGPIDQYWYSFDLGAWHLVALNSNCTNERVACDEGSAQDRWLRADLAAHPSQCTLAFFHHPRFSSGLHGDDESLATIYRDLYLAGVDVVVAGHDHNYERIQPLDPEGNPDVARGIRNFVVGTGGRSLRRGTVEARPITEAWNDDTLGVLVLSLEPAAYTWQFIPIEGGAYTDSGSAACR